MSSAPTDDKRHARRHGMDVRPLASSRLARGIPAEQEHRFFLHVAPAERVLWCRHCGNQTSIEDRPWAMVDAQAAHDCGLACRCWSTSAHGPSCANDRAR